MIEIGNGNKILPLGYQQLEYLESSGTQYIETGVIATINTGFYVKYLYVAAGSAAISGIYQPNSPRTDAFFVSTRSGYLGSTNLFGCQCGHAASENILVEYNKLYISKINYKNDKSLFIGESSATGSISSELPYQRSIPIFARFNPNINTIACSSSRIFEVQFTEYTNVSHNLIPARRLADGVLGMFDTVTNTFLTNAGTGEFIAGPDVEPATLLVKDKVVTNGSGTPSIAKQVYVKDKLVHLHTKDNTAFTDRITCNGEIKINKDIAGQIEGIRGRTLVWNQIMSSMRTYESTAINLTASIDAQGRLSISGTPSSVPEYRQLRITENIPFKRDGRKYLIKANKEVGMGWNVMGYGAISQNYIFFSKTEGTDWNTGLYISVTNTTTPINISNLIFSVFDLTQMFGAGNEPTTVAEFEALFPNDYYPYDAGRLLNFTGVGLKSVGFNIWDEEWEEGVYSSTSGAKANLTNAIRSKNYIKCFPNTTYKSGNNRFRWLEYDSNFNFIKFTATTANLTTLPNTAYITFYITDYGSTYNHDLRISLLDGTYRPYKSDTAEFDVTTIVDGNNNPVFPDGLRRAGNVYDEIVVDNGVTKAIKKVGSVDLGTLNWTSDSYPSTGQMYFDSSSVSGLKGNYFRVTTKNIRYIDNHWSSVFDSRTDKSIFTNGANSRIYITDSDYTDATAFGASLSGIIAYYELETPEEYTLSGIKLPIPYYANGLGTESIISNSQANPATAPADMDIDYRLEEEEWYGIRWRMTDDTWVAPVRIGNPNLHRTLPLQNMMRRCAIVNGAPKYISDIDPDVYEDGTAVSYSTTDIYVEVPEYYFEATQDADGWCELRLHTKLKTGKRSRLYYPGAWRATLDGTVLGSKSYINFGNIGSPTDNTYAAALFKDATNFVSNTPIGGDGTARSDTEGCTIGRPKTSTNMTNFRTYAQNNDSRCGIINYDCWCSIMRLFFVEYCTFDSQAALDNTLSILGFKKGGLSAGVTTVTDSTYSWSAFNGYNPLIPCGLTKHIGNKTGVVAFEYSAGNIAANKKSVLVPSYRGIEEPFGDVYCITDGIVFYGDEANFKNYVYIATDATIDNLAYVTPSGANTTPTGYELLTEDLPGGPSSGSSVVNSGWIKKWLWNSNGMFVPVSYGGGGTNYMPDYAWSYNAGWKMLLAGGVAYDGSRAGLGCFIAYDGVDVSYASIGSRLLYTPQS